MKTCVMFSSKDLRGSLIGIWKDRGTRIDLFVTPALTIDHLQMSIKCSSFVSVTEFSLQLFFLAHAKSQKYQGKYPLFVVRDYH